MSMQGVALLEDDYYNDEVIIDIESIAAHMRLEEITCKVEQGLYLYRSDVVQYFSIIDEIALLIDGYFKKSALGFEDALNALKLSTILQEHYGDAIISRREKFLSKCMLKYHMNLALERFRIQSQDSRQLPAVRQSSSPSFITQAFERHCEATTTSYYPSAQSSNSQQDDTTCVKNNRRSL